MKTLYRAIKITAGVFLLALLAASCFPEQETIGGAGKTLITYTPGDQFSLFAIDAKTTPQSFILINVKKEIPNATALNTTSVVTLTLDTDTSMIKKYNTKHGTNFIPMPVALYNTTPALSSNKVMYTFNPEEFDKELKVTIPNASLFDFSKKYMICFKMTMSGEGSISEAVSDTIYRQVLAKNKYDGKYAMKGFIMRPGDTGGLEGYFSGHVKTLSTTGASSCTMSPNQLWANGGGVGGIGTWTLTVIESGTPPYAITVTDPVAVNWRMDPAYPNRYDPDTKTFYFKVNWGATIPYIRGCTDTLVYTGQ